MKLQLESGKPGNLIAAYAPGAVTVNQQVYTRSLIVTPDRIIEHWPPQSFEQLQARHLEDVPGLNIEILLLGSGARQRFPGAALMGALAGQGIGLEVMDTGAACRTFNILAAEGRRVAAALLMIEEPD